MERTCWIASTDSTKQSNNLHGFENRNPFALRTQSKWILASAEQMDSLKLFFVADFARCVISSPERAIEVVAGSESIVIINFLKHAWWEWSIEVVWRWRFIQFINFGSDASTKKWWNLLGGVRWANFPLTDYKKSTFPLTETWFWRVRWASSSLAHTDSKILVHLRCPFELLVKVCFRNERGAQHEFWVWASTPPQFHSLKQWRNFPRFPLWTGVRMSNPTTRFRYAESKETLQTCEHGTRAWTLNLKRQTRASTQQL